MNGLSSFKQVYLLLLMSLSIVVGFSNGIIAQESQSKLSDTILQNSNPGTLDLDLIREFEGRISTLEEANKNLNGSLTTAKWIATILVAIVAALIAFLRYSIAKKEEKESRKLENYLKKVDENNSKLTASNEAYYNKTQKNIKAVTDLIRSLDEIFKISNSAKELERKTKILEEEALKIQSKQEKERKNILNEAREIYNEIDRDSYKKLYYENKLSKFSSSFLSLLQEGEENELNNPFCFFLVGLHFNLQVMFNDSLSYFEKTIKVIQSSREEYSDLLFDCYYHKAIIYYNFGFYDKAFESFKKCTELNGKDLLMWTYLPEAMHFIYLRKVDTYKAEFGSNIPSDKELELKEDEERVKNEFIRIEKVLRDKSDDLNSSKARRIIALLNIKFGNFYFRPFKDSLVKNKFYKERLSNAEGQYKNAVSIDDKFYLSKLSLRQVEFIKLKMGLNLSDLDKKNMQDDVMEVYRTIRKKVGDTTETKIVIMYYYILAICEKMLKILDPHFAAQDFIDEIYELKKQIPNPLEVEETSQEIRIYSPYSKQDLTFDEIISELEESTLV